MSIKLLYNTVDVNVETYDMLSIARLFGMADILISPCVCVCVCVCVSVIRLTIGFSGTSGCFKTYSTSLVRLGI